MIKEWLSHQDQTDKYIFKLIYVTEKTPPKDDLIFLLQEKIITSYRNIDFLKFHHDNSSETEIREYVVNYIIPTDKDQFGRNVKQGDWGEILSALIVAYFQNLEVPINKLQWKVNKDKAVFGTDLIAFNKCHSSSSLTSSGISSSIFSLFEFLSALSFTEGNKAVAKIIQIIKIAINNHLPRIF